MAALNRAYEGEYSYKDNSMVYERTTYYGNTLPKRQYHPERERQTERKPEIKQVPKTNSGEEAFFVLTEKAIFRAVLLLAFIGVLLLGTIWMNAKAAEIQFSINKLNKENITLDNEISLLNIKVESANGIEQVEDYATKELKMRYPKSNQCIYITEGSKLPEGLVSTIRKKAYE